MNRKNTKLLTVGPSSLLAALSLAALLGCGSEVGAPPSDTTSSTGGGGMTATTTTTGGSGGTGGTTSSTGGQGPCEIPANATVGLQKHNGDSAGGYTMLAPTGTTRSYLLDECGQVVHEWQSTGRPGLSTYLLENGDLLRAENVGKMGSTFKAGGTGGRVIRQSWAGDMLWSYTYSTDNYRQHHDVELLPNGNVLLIAWEKKSEAEAIAAGRDPNLIMANELWPDHIIEVEPQGATDGKIVWQWHVWDHLVQAHDPKQDNYGDPADHPELVDINFAKNGNADWLHINGVDYNAEHDQIILSVHNLNEVWIIDHSTTTAEAASHSGGKSGKGGDLLYRWGNPGAYGAGSKSDERLFGQHDAQWIPAGLPGEGEILIFNNGMDRPEGDYSTVEQIALPVDSNGKYELAPGMAFGPKDTSWSYKSEPPTNFFSRNISGAHRLANGNTMICSGANGTLFEVTAAGDVVWQYINPVSGMGQIVKQGEPIPMNNMGEQSNPVFRAYRYAADYPGLAGRDLTPQGTLE